MLYYGDAGYWTGTMRIGEFDDMQAVAEQSDDFDRRPRPVGRSAS